MDAEVEKLVIMTKMVKRRRSGRRNLKSAEPMEDSDREVFSGVQTVSVVDAGLESWLTLGCQTATDNEQAQSAGLTRSLKRRRVVREPCKSDAVKTDSDGKSESESGPLNPLDVSLPCTHSDFPHI